jgi:hypothetical protein
VAAVREEVRRDKLFIAIDHEGGRVCRTPPLSLDMRTQALGRAKPERSERPWRWNSHRLE